MHNCVLIWVEVGPCDLFVFVVFVINIFVLFLINEISSSKNLFNILDTNPQKNQVIMKSAFLIYFF